MQGKATVKTVTAETQTIAVAVVDLTWGTVIGKHMLRTEPYLKSSLRWGIFRISLLLRDEFCFFQ
jgi:Flp pilus assembly protein CpaB